MHPLFLPCSDLHHKLLGFMTYLKDATGTKRLRMANQNWCNFYGSLLVISALYEFANSEQTLLSATTSVIFIPLGLKRALVMCGA